VAIESKIRHQIRLSLFERRKTLDIRDWGFLALKQFVNWPVCSFYLTLRRFSLLPTKLTLNVLISG
jgi:hypothetical protein